MLFCFEVCYYDDEMELADTLKGYVTGKSIGDAAEKVVDFVGGISSVETIKISLIEGSTTGLVLEEDMPE